MCRRCPYEREQPLPRINLPRSRTPVRPRGTQHLGLGRTTSCHGRPATRCGWFGKGNRPGRSSVPVAGHGDSLRSQSRGRGASGRVARPSAPRGPWDGARGGLGPVVLLAGGRPGFVERRLFDGRGVPRSRGSTHRLAKNAVAAQGATPAAPRPRRPRGAAPDEAGATAGRRGLTGTVRGFLTRATQPMRSFRSSWSSRNCFPGTVRA